MMKSDLGLAPARKPVPRGIALTGPAILAYGFRPFFLAAGSFALLTMLGWIGALSFGWPLGGTYGALNWHAHEMLFGYSGAALAGFVLTAIPNWTGRLPVSGQPLLALVSLWLVGRLTVLAPEILGLTASILIEAAFLPALALIAAREIIAGHNWKNLKILAGLSALAATNIAFHILAAGGGDTHLAARLAVSIYALLIALVGGRMVPSFTRNWLAKAGRKHLPAPFSLFDVMAVLLLLAALMLWSLVPDGAATAFLALVSAVVQALRLRRWQGWQARTEPMLFVLHLGFVFLPLGLLAIALAAMGGVSQASALHVLTVGAIGTMTLAVMTRVTRGHTGRPLTASALTTLSYLAMLLAATLRPLAEYFPANYLTILAAGAVFWIAAFLLFLAEYAPFLLTHRPIIKKLPS